MDKYLQESYEDALRDNTKLNSEVERLRSELQGAMLLIAYAIKKNGGKLELPDTFVLDYSHCNIELKKEICCDKQATAYYARTKGESYTNF
jgi:hypothetical protein